MIMEMLRAGEVREDDDSYQSPLDELFERLEMRSPDHIAVKYYKDYRSGSAKTLKSIQITLAARLEKFNLSSVAALTATDELDLASLGEKKVALFALIPDNDSSFNFSQPALCQHLPGTVLQRRPGAWRQPARAGAFPHGRVCQRQLAGRFRQAAGHHAEPEHLGVHHHPEHCPA